MTRPRLAAILSAIVASTVAFFVTHRWSLAGTLTGAAVVPVVYSLVSHWSNEGLDRLARWTRGRLDRRLRQAATTPADRSLSRGAGTRAVAAPGTAPTPVPTLYVTRGTARRQRASLQWWLTAAVLLAFGFSLYSFATAGSGEKVVVEKQVVEKTVLITSPTTTTTTPAESETTTSRPPETSSPPVSETSTSDPAPSTPSPEPDAQSAVTSP
jgi:hypothetical protein